MKAFARCCFGGLMGFAMVSSATFAQTADPPLLSGPNTPPGITRPRLLPPWPSGYYPPIAIRCHWEGTPASELLIDADGHVVSATITKSSGNATLDQAALNAEKQLHWQPATRDGIAIAVRWPMQLQFGLRDAAERDRPIPSNCPVPPVTNEDPKPN